MKSTSIRGGLKRLLSMDLAFFGGSVVIKLVDYDGDDGDARSNPSVLIMLVDYDDGYDRDSDDDANDDDDDHGCNAGSNPSVVIKLVDYFLNLFPVFTLSTNFPIIAITLRCRLQYFTANVDSTLAQSLYH